VFEAAVESVVAAFRADDATEIVTAVFTLPRGQGAAIIRRACADRIAERVRGDAADVPPRSNT
jgi:hypothetical protein